MTPASRRALIVSLAAVLLSGGAFLWWKGGSARGGNGTDNDSLITMGDDEAKSDAVKLTMKLASSSITGIENGYISAVNKVVVQNPLPVPLTAHRWDYTVLVNGVKVAEGSSAETIRLPAGGSQTVDLPTRINVRTMDNIADKVNASGDDEATYTFQNTFYTDVPIAGERKIRYNFEEELPVVQSLEVNPSDLDLNDFGLRNSGMRMTLQVSNPNAFTIRMKDSRFRMTVDGKTTMNGELQEVVSLPAKGTVPVEVQLDLKTGRALKMGWKMLVNNKNARYELEMDSRILSDSKLLRNSSMHVREEGLLADLKKELKKEVKER